MNASTHEDRYGLPLSTSSAEAAEAYRDGIDLMLAAWPGAAEAFERAIAADPDFALAHVARARIHTFYQQSEAARQRAALSSPRSSISRRGRAMRW
jgi:Tfp pilus assembly protein PilF